MSSSDSFKAYDVKITRGPHRGKTARVVGYANAGTLSRVAQLSCKFADGTYKMIPEAWTQPVSATGERP